jgi:hypothetical protein
MFKVLWARLSSSPAPLAALGHHAATLFALRYFSPPNLIFLATCTPRCCPLAVLSFTPSLAAVHCLLISSSLLLARHSSPPTPASELAESPLLSSELAIEPRLPCVTDHHFSSLLLAWYGHVLQTELLHAMCYFSALLCCACGLLACVLFAGCACLLAATTALPVCHV